MRKMSFLILGAALSAATCAQKPPAAPAPATAASAAPAVDWAAMNKEQRKDYMKKVVMPQMKETFVAFDADRYKSMNCITCHGEGATEGKFTMPNPKLPKLPATPDGFHKLMTEKPAVMQFMATKVKPQMAHLLGMPEFTPQSKTGFGCFQCHTKEGQ
jgi:cytochrome c553